VKLTITGFSNSGKTTVFNALTGLGLETTTYPASISAEVEPHVGVVKIPDLRVDKLSDIYDPKKTTYATVEYIDYLGITSAAAGGDVSQNSKVFNLIKDADAIVHVVRAFEDESIIHPMNTIDPVRDAASFEDELILGDLEFVEKRLEKIQEQEKKGKKQDEADKKLLLKCKKALEDEISLRDIEFDNEETRLMLPYQFLTTMPELIVLNIHENDLNSDKVKELQDKIETYFKEKGRVAVPPVISLCGKIEMEIAQLPQDEAKAFLDDLGIDEPAMHKLCHVSYDALGLISFLTIGKDEVRAWTIKKGTPAQQTAGKIHSDIERGFIRAEVVSYDDFISSEADMVKAREKGLVRLEGKTYPVRDGDIINFKFNV
jgi:GTP-binding protein YchF